MGVNSGRPKSRSATLLAASLTAWRKRTDRSLKQIADDLGVSTSAVGAWMTGNRFPSEQHLDSLSITTGMPISCLVCTHAYCPNVVQIDGYSSHPVVAERKQVETRERLGREPLERLNHPSDIRHRIRSITASIKAASDIEAIGIRLRSGDDFPYYYTDGFPSRFVQAERSLHAHNEAGALVLDKNNNPVLECMCGNIICGRTDPTFPFFTEGGSFWSNCTTELLASTTEQDRQANTRNRCNREGYESVALIPLKANCRTIGLLQLNDHMRDRFSPFMIQSLEGIGASLGIAVERNRAQYNR